MSISYLIVDLSMRVLLLLPLLLEDVAARALQSWFRKPTPPAAHKFIIPQQSASAFLGHATVPDRNADIDVTPLLSVWVARPRWAINKEIETYFAGLGTEGHCPKGAGSVGFVATTTMDMVCHFEALEFLPSLATNVNTNAQKGLGVVGITVEKPLVDLVDSGKTNYFFNRDGPAWALAFSKAGFRPKRIRATGRTNFKVSSTPQGTSVVVFVSGVGCLYILPWPCIRPTPLSIAGTQPNAPSTCAYARACMHRALHSCWLGRLKLCQAIQATSMFCVTNTLRTRFTRC